MEVATAKLVIVHVLTPFMEILAIFQSALVIVPGTASVKSTQESVSAKKVSYLLTVLKRNAQMTVQEMEIVFLAENVNAPLVGLVMTAQAQVARKTVTVMGFVLKENVSATMVSPENLAIIKYA
jgi:hypothetical protein